MCWNVSIPIPIPTANPDFLSFGDRGRDRVSGSVPRIEEYCYNELRCSVNTISLM